eukprot:GGOE01030456.1.p1 GENE.GGOE01030456.1~~GGOE01030456.1.p1  ORF type:complete len:1000 (-),score=273.11 GGOE01030456.1:297-2939(-)
MNEVVDTFAGLMETVVADFKDVASSYALELRSELATKASSALTTVVTTRATGLQRFQSMYELGVLHPSRAASDPVTNDDCLLLAAVCDGALEFGYWETLNLVSAAGRFYSCVPGEGALLSVLSIDGSHYNESHETWLPNSVQGKMRQRCMSEQPISTTVGENCSLPQNCQCGSDQRCSLWYTPHLADSTPRLLVSDVYVGKYGTPQFTLSYPVVNSSDASSPVLAVASTEFAFTSVATYLASLSVSNSTYLAALLNDTNLSIMGSLGRKCGTNETAPGDPGLPLWSALRACDSNTREVAQWLLQHRSTIQQSCTVELSGIIWNIFPDSSTVVAYFCIVGTKKEDLYRAIDSSDAKAASQLSTVRLQQLGKVAASGKATQAYMTVVQAENIQEVQAMQDSYLEQMEELEASSRSTLTASQQNSTAEVEHLMISQTSEVDQLKAKHLDALAAATGWTIAVVFAILIVVLLLSAWGTVRITRSLTHIIELMEDVAEMRVEDLELPQNSHVTEVARIQSAFRVLIARLTEYKGYMPAGLFEREEEEEEEGEESMLKHDIDTKSDISNDNPSSNRSKTTEVKHQLSTSLDASTSIQPRQRVRIGVAPNSSSSRSTKKNVAALCLNIVGFRDVMDKVADGLTSSIFNQYVTAVHESVSQGRGNVDCILGDQIFVTFNAHVPCAEPAGAAVAAALEMRRLLWQIVRERLKFQIGISYGPVLAGSVGYSKFRSMAALGHSMKVASMVSQMSDFESGTVLVDTTVEEKMKYIYDLRPVELVHFPQLRPMAWNTPTCGRVFLVEAKRDVDEDEWLYQVDKMAPQSDWHWVFEQVAAAQTAEEGRSHLEQFLEGHPQDSMALRLKNRLAMWTPGVGLPLWQRAEHGPSISP